MILNFRQNSICKLFQKKVFIAFENKRGTTNKPSNYSYLVVSMASLEPLGLSFKSHHTGKDVSVAWEFFWILQHKKQNYNQYCFGIFRDNHRYEDKMRLDNRNMYRLTLTVPFLQRIFPNEVLRTANGVE